MQTYIYLLAGGSLLGAVLSLFFSYKSPIYILILLSLLTILAVLYLIIQNKRNIIINMISVFLLSGLLSLAVTSNEADTINKKYLNLETKKIKNKKIVITGYITDIPFCNQKYCKFHLFSKDLGLLQLYWAKKNISDNIKLKSGDFWQLPVKLKITTWL